MVRVGAAPEPVRRLATGIAALDALLGGGIPRGRLTELVGPLAAAKTSLLCAAAALLSRRGELIGWVDVGDALHPAALAANAADLTRIVWVRPRAAGDALRCTELLLDAGGFGFVVLDLGHPLPRRLRRHTWTRLLRAAERSHTAVVIAAPQRVAGSFASMTVRCMPRAVRWRSGWWCLFEGFDIGALLARNKLGAPGRHARLHVGGGAPSADAAETGTVDAYGALR